MISILKDRKELAAAVSQVAEVAGYLWENGWAERNGGNITVNVSDYVDDICRQMPAISPAKEIGITLPEIAGNYFYCKGTGKRMRDLTRQPMENGSIIRVCDDGRNYEIIADNPVMPTSELPTHLLLQNYFLQTGSSYRATLHTHPIELVAMSHIDRFLDEEELTHVLWSMIPETLAFAPLGLGVIPYALPSSVDLAKATLEGIKKHDVVMWEKHGTVAVGRNIMEAFDQTDVLCKAAKIYMCSKAMGEEPQGLSAEDITEIKKAFNLPKKRIL
jgi:rhamnulose-1-phosphate aldolase